MMRRFLTARNSPSGCSRNHWPLDLHFRSRRDSIHGGCFCNPTLPIFLAAIVILLWLAEPRAQGQYTPPAPPPPPTARDTTTSAPPPVLRSAEQFDRLLARIALYPDPLLVQTLTASTYWNQISKADHWAAQNNFMTGVPLADAINEDNLPWDASVVALLPFQSVLHMMAQNPAWTQQLGYAVLTQRADVMDSVQRLRNEAHKYGYLQTTSYDSVTDSDSYIRIVPANPDYIFVPKYDPLLVFGPPPPRYLIGDAIRFDPAIVLGAKYYQWGWAHPYFTWDTHTIWIDDTPWGRGWDNKGFYFHSYAHNLVKGPGPKAEHHESPQ
jgi:hypothetical protein